MVSNSLGWAMMKAPETVTETIEALHGKIKNTGYFIYYI